MNYELRIKNQSGFTLIEILVVSAILLTVGVMVVQLLFSSLKGGSKSAILSTVKENGDYALTVMERMIRNSREVLCSPTSLTIKNPDGNQTTFLCDGVNPTKIASISASATYYLTSDSVTVPCPLFDCTQLTDKKIGINFTVSQYLPGVTPKLEETAQMDFQTTVTLRNY